MSNNRVKVSFRGRSFGAAGRVVFCILLVTLHGSPAAGQQTSENSEFLRNILRKYPEADKDRDGVLTAAEAREYREVVLKKRGGKARAPRNEGGIKPDLENVRYGPHERNVLDLWKAQSANPTPIVVFIHGGGFVTGDKSAARAKPLLRECLDAGVSFASINYRFRQHAPIQDILRDGARAIQFIRFKAKDWNIDPHRIGAYGGSAGAGTSLWIAFHDDLANPASDDPVLRQSSRLACAGSMNGQASYDMRFWKEVMGPSPDSSRKITPELYGVESLDDLDDPQVKKILDEVNMIGHLSADDPPVFLFCSYPDTDPKTRGHYVHHPRHSIAIQRRCRELNVECDALLPRVDGSAPGSLHDRLRDFFFKHLHVKRETESNP